LDTRYAKAERITLVCDNLNTHTRGAFYEAFAAVKAREYVRRIQFVYTPKHGSWLNQVEIWFGILTRCALRNASTDSLAALDRVVLAFTRHWNEVIGHPFRWTYTGKVLSA